MKVIQIIFMILILNIPVNSELREMKPVILINNYSGRIDRDCLTPQAHFKVLTEYCYFQEFDTLKYINKSLGFIIDDLSKQFELIESRTYTNWETFKPDDEFDRTHFKFVFKKDDSSGIEINGCVTNPQDMIHEKNDSIALRHVLTIESYVLEVLLLDVKERYRKLKKLYLKEKSAIVKQRIKYYKRNFPKICK